MTDQPRPPLPPFTAESAAEKARKAEDARNTRKPKRVAAAYTPDSLWRNRAEFFSRREAIMVFRMRKCRASRCGKHPTSPVEID